MRKLFGNLNFQLAVFMTAVFCALSAVAQEIIPPSVDDIQKFMEAIGGWKSLGTLGAVAVVVQGLMLVLKSKAGAMTGKLQLLLVTGLTMIGGIVSLKLSGIDWSAALLHSSTLASAQVFLFQVWKQFQKA